MRGRWRFVVLAATAMAIYALAVWLFLLPPVRLPPEDPLTTGKACPDPSSLDRLRERQVVLFVSLVEISPHVVDALLQQEDPFYHHHGVDWEQLARALALDLRAREYRYGAGTLTMQLVRELFLDKDRTVLRKLREIAYALQAERRLSKQEILELYLNVVHWGPGIRGVGVASCYYFGVPPAALSPEEAREIVSVLPNPERLGPALRERRSTGGAEGVPVVAAVMVTG